MCFIKLPTDFPEEPGCFIHIVFLYITVCIRGLRDLQQPNLEYYRVCLQDWTSENRAVRKSLFMLLFGVFFAVSFPFLSWSVPNYHSMTLMNRPMRSRLWVVWGGRGKTSSLPDWLLLCITLIK